MIIWDKKIIAIIIVGLGIITATNNLYSKKSTPNCCNYHKRTSITIYTKMRLQQISSKQIILISTTIKIFPNFSALTINSNNIIIINPSIKTYKESNKQ